MAHFVNGMQIRTMAVMTVIINQTSLMASVNAAFSTRGLSMDMWLRIITLAGGQDS